MGAGVEVVYGCFPISGSQTGHVEQFHMGGFNWGRVAGVLD